MANKKKENKRLSIAKYRGDIEFLEGDVYEVVSKDNDPNYSRIGTFVYVKEPYLYKVNTSGNPMFYCEVTEPNADNIKFALIEIGDVGAVDRPCKDSKLRCEYRGEIYDGEHYECTGWEGNAPALVGDIFAVKDYRFICVAGNNLGHDLSTNDGGSRKGRRPYFKRVDKPAEPVGVGVPASGTSIDFSVADNIAYSYGRGNIPNTAINHDHLEASNINRISWAAYPSAITEPE